MLKNSIKVLHSFPPTENIEGSIVFAVFIKNAKFGEGVFGRGKRSFTEYLEIIEHRFKNEFGKIVQ